MPIVHHEAMLAEDETTNRKGLHIGSVLFWITVFALITAKGERDMLKKLTRLTVAMIFGSLILMNLSLAYASSSARRAAEVQSGSLFTHPGYPPMCICLGMECVLCVTLSDSE